MSPKHLLIALAILVAAGLAALVILKPAGGNTVSAVANIVTPKAVVQLASEPGGAEIWIDGERKGNTPEDKGMTFAINLPVGTHRVEVRLPKEPVRWIANKEVVVAADTVQSISLNLIEDSEQRAAFDHAEALRKAKEDIDRAEREAEKRRLEIGRLAVRTSWEESGETATLTVDGVKQVFVRIKPGSFTMGSPSSEQERNTDENAIQVTLTRSYWLAKTECTAAMYRMVMGNTGYYDFKGPEYPVGSVSWQEATQACQRVTEILLPRTLVVRLPTEAEWEYACRAGTTTPFNTGLTISTDQANFDGSTPYGLNKMGAYRRTTTLVASFAPNAWGLYDMHGNVGEWCSDWKAGYSYSPEIDPVGPPSGSVKVLRGGTWDNYANKCRSAHRNDWSPELRNNSIGFRMVAQSTK